MRLRTTIVVEHDVNPTDYELEDLSPENIAAAEQQILEDDGGYLIEMLSFEDAKVYTEAVV